MSRVANTLDMQQIEFRAVIKFLTKQGKGPSVILSEMKAVYGDKCPGKTMVYKWISMFQEGREMIEDKPRALTFKRRRTEPTPLFKEIPPPKDYKEIDVMDSAFDDEAFIDELQNEYLDSEP